LTIASPAFAQYTSKNIETSSKPGASYFLTEDGELNGFVYQLEDGDKIPVGAKVSLVRDGEVIVETKSNKDGNFVMTSLVPGEYELAAVSEELMSTSKISIAEYSEEATVDALVVPVPMVPAAPQDVVVDSLPVDSMVGGPVGGPVMTETYSFAGSSGGFSGGGGFGGGGIRGRRWGALGLVGLVGLAGLAGDDASPDN